jgi:hypothetical protein
LTAAKKEIFEQIKNPAKGVIWMLCSLLLLNALHTVLHIFLVALNIFLFE